MKKFEYHTATIGGKGTWGVKIDVDEFNTFLNNMGRDGWELIETTFANETFGATKYTVCIFKRELVG